MSKEKSKTPSMPEFKGARGERKSFKQAVEDYLLEHYRDQITKGNLTMADLRSNPTIAIAVKTYKERFYVAPFGIRSRRGIALERLASVLEVGYKKAGRRDRDAANRLIRRIEQK